MIPEDQEVEAALDQHRHYFHRYTDKNTVRGRRGIKTICGMVVVYSAYAARWNDLVAHPLCPTCSFRVTYDT